MHLKTKLVSAIMSKRGENCHVHVGACNVEVEAGREYFLALQCFQVTFSKDLHTENFLY
jgi:hypothetical protein